jgi:RimJ/RimL family protein N-acetyltransferase
MSFIRRLTEVDTHAFRDIRLEGLRLYPSAFGADYEDERVQPDAWFRARVLDHAVFGAFLDDGTLAGVAGLMIPSGAKLKHKGTLWGMYVRPVARGTGLAAALMLQVVDYAKERVEALTLHCSPDNAAAIRRYEAAGFSVYATEPRALKIDGIYFDSLLMEKRF